LEDVDKRELKILLFPFLTKYLGLIFILCGLISGYLYFYGGRPSFFNVKVFALVSSYLETRYFCIIKTNILDEIAAIFLVAGLTLLAFSKEKPEKREYMAVRFKSWVYSVYLSVILWILIFLLVYGYSIFLASPLVFILLLIIYNIIFRIMASRT
jgi:apolipoprotein N-acyltransferase